MINLEKELIELNKIKYLKNEAEIKRFDEILINIYKYKDKIPLYRLYNVFDDNTEDDTDAKETAKQDLITAIQNDMTESLNNGEEYTLQDLEGLQIDGHTVEVEVSDDLAVVTVDGYTFNIDSEFNLSE